MQITFDLSQDEADDIDSVFPGGLVSSREDVFEALSQDIARTLGNVLSARRDVAMSGAMRWPWSQEAYMIRQTRQYFK
jgi:hypothetical protein